MFWYLSKVWYVINIILYFFLLEWVNKKYRLDVIFLNCLYRKKRKKIVFLKDFIMDNNIENIIIILCVC